MVPRVIKAHYVAEYTIHITFGDGLEGEVDLAGELWGPVFEPLRDKAVFAKFRVHPELHTLVWDSGADLSPEYLYSVTRVTA